MTICNHNDCKKQALYNLNDLKPRWCKAHKTQEMINVVSKRCSCGKIPSFNLPGETIGVCCNECKTPGMIDVINKRCACGNRSYYNLPEETIGLYCRNCKMPKMIDVVNKKCACGKRPSFNLPGKTIGVCCYECKMQNMLNVVNKRCSCGKIPSFNLPGEAIGVCCKECKTPEMTDVINKKCTGYDGEKCPGGYLLVPGCQYCLSCDPDDSRRDKFKKYENAFFRHIKGKIDVKRREYIVSYDPLETSKKFARLDGIVFGDNIIVCLEVDENGHACYACDETRMHLVTAELLQQYPGVDVCWIRVNPTTQHKNPWGIAAKRVRAERFDAVVKVVNNVLKNNMTNVVYIGFD